MIIDHQRGLKRLEPSAVYFDSLSAAMTMGGNGGYVWSAYAITFAVLGVVILRPILSSRRLRRISGQNWLVKPQRME